uniref:Uncharacterized protein n=1 Tax=Rhizophagus irregularis (strain DAOM 181602 / DAOM 197198 / MUCL 43194) TaxID=747089 RepID=U9UJ36_RHIID
MTKLNYYINLSSENEKITLRSAQSIDKTWSFRHEFLKTIRGFFLMSAQSRIKNDHHNNSSKMVK